MINLNWMEFNEDSGDKVDVIFIVEISSVKKTTSIVSPRYFPGSWEAWTHSLLWSSSPSSDFMLFEFCLRSNVGFVFKTVEKFRPHIFFGDLSSKSGSLASIFIFSLRCTVYNS